MPRNNILSVFSSLLCDCIFYTPVVIYCLTRDCFVCTAQTCKDTSDYIEQYIADNEFNCCSIGTPADLNSRMERVHQPRQTKKSSLKSEINDILG